MSSNFDGWMNGSFAGASGCVAPDSVLRRGKRRSKPFPISQIFLFSVLTTFLVSDTFHGEE
jgi:hypothetical protein